MCLPSHLLVVLVLALPVGAPCPTPGQICTAANIAVKEGDAIIGFFSVEIPNDTLFGNVYVRPDASFQGVTVWGQGIHGTNGVWFPIPSQCFPRTSMWYEMEVRIWIDKNLSIIYQGFFVAVFMTKLQECTFGCSMKVQDNEFYRLEVTAHGPSSWRMTAPNASCPTAKVTSYANFSLKTCPIPPSSRNPVMCPTAIDEPNPPTPFVSPTQYTPTPISHTTSTSSELVLVVVIVVVVVVVLVVVMGVAVVAKVRTSLLQETTGGQSTTARTPPAPRRLQAPPPAAPHPPCHLGAPRGWPAEAPSVLHSPTRPWQVPEENVYEEIYTNAA